MEGAIGVVEGGFRRVGYALLAEKKFGGEEKKLEGRFFQNF